MIYAMKNLQLNENFIKYYVRNFTNYKEVNCFYFVNNTFLEM